MKNFQFQKSLELLIYKLKFQFESGPLDLYYNITYSTDLTTGVRTFTNRDYKRIPIAIVLPESSVKQIVLTISKIGADKQFAWGGEYVRDTRVFLLSGCDLTGIEFDVDSWFIYNSQKYRIVKMVDYYDGVLYFIQGREVQGETFTQVHETAVYDTVSLEESSVDG